MGKTLVRSRVRVEVEPRYIGDFGMVRTNMFDEAIEDTIRRAEAIAEQIRRHVDDLPSYTGRGVTVEWDTDAVCEHCGHTWTEGDSPHNGGCCAEDCKMFDAHEAAEVA